MILLGFLIGLLTGLLVFWRPWRKIAIKQLQDDVAWHRERLQWWADYAGGLARRIAELEDTTKADWWREDEP